MSVLFKALQKAEKENEQRQGAGAGFDPSRLAGSGAIKLAGGSGLNWRVMGLAAAGVLAVAIAAAFFLVEAPPSSQQIAAGPRVVAPVAPGTTEAIPLMQPPTGSAPAPAQQTAATTPPPATQEAAATPSTQQPATGAPPAEAAQQPATPAPQTVAAATAPEPAPPAQSAAAAPAPAPVAEPAPEETTPATETVQAEKPKAPVPERKVAAVSPPRKEAMPDLAPDSRARMLNPPIAIQRADFELSGVGNAVQVREVSAQAQNNVSAGYNALVRGAYDMSLDFYDRALKEEPSSVLALLGRSTALQKMGRNEEARAGYEKVLKIDPPNREALSNLTTLIGESAPSEALPRLLEIDKENPGFSPVKAQIGLTYAKLGQMPLALDYLTRATAMAPNSVMYQYNLALVLDHLGRREQAVAVYETVLASLSGGSAPELSSTDIERRVRYLKTPR